MIESNQKVEATASQTASATMSKVVNGRKKSSLNVLDSIAMAANIQKIAYSNGSYTVSFYDGTGDYTVFVYD